MGSVAAERHAGVGRKLHDSRRQRVQLPLPAQQVFPTLPKPALHFGDPVAALHKPADLFRAEVFRQAGRGEGLAPTSPGGAEFLFRFAGAARGRLRLLPGRAATRVQGRQLLQGRQVLLGRLQPARKRSPAARQLRVQRVAIGLGLLNLELEHAELFLAGVELMDVRPFQQHLCRSGGAGAGQAQ